MTNLLFGNACIGFEVSNKRFLTHIAYNLFWSIERTFVLIVFEQVLKDLAQHLRVYTHLGIIGVVLINGKIVFAEELEQAFEVIGREFSILPVAKKY